MPPAEVYDNKQHFKRASPESPFIVPCYHYGVIGPNRPSYHGFGEFNSIVVLYIIWTLLLHVLMTEHVVWRTQSGGVWRCPCKPIDLVELSLSSMYVLIQYIVWP